MMLVRSFRASLLLVSTFFAVPSGFARADRPVDPPDAPGPFHVGYASLTIPVSPPRNTAQATVWYPTEVTAGCAGRYTVKVVRPGGVVDSYTLSSPLCAVENADVAEPGGYPLIVYDHGGNVNGIDVQRWGQIPLFEHLASHGFVVVVALHVLDRGIRAADLQKVILEMLRRNGADPLLRGAIDPERIGLSGVSAGGGTAVAAVAGWPEKNVAPESRAKALLVYEPDPGSYSLADASTMEIPYLLMHGDQFALSVPSYTVLLAATTAVRRIVVYDPGALHRSYDTGLCLQIDETREAALLANPTLPDPLTHLITGNAAAEAAYTGWNFAMLQYAALGSGVGGGRNFCNRVGVDSAVLPLDADDDGYTDSPPYLGIDPPYVLAEAPAAEVTTPLIKLYSVAFWKTFLAGDRRYMPYLTPGYASANRLHSIVTVWE